MLISVGGRVFCCAARSMAENLKASMRLWSATDICGANSCAVSSLPRFRPSNGAGGLPPPLPWLLLVLEGIVEDNVFYVGLNRWANKQSQTVKERLRCPQTAGFFRALFRKKKSLFAS